MRSAGRGLPVGPMMAVTCVLFMGRPENEKPARSWTSEPLLHSFVMITRNCSMGEVFQTSIMQPAGLAAGIPFPRYSCCLHG